MANKDLPTNIKVQTYGDFHVHSGHSFDGVYTLESMIDAARGVGSYIGEDKEDGTRPPRRMVTWLAFTDHDNMEGPRDLWRKNNEPLDKPYIVCNGVNVVSGVEVTCRLNSIRDGKGRSIKLHMLIYGASLDPNSPLSRLMAAKYKNDTDYDFGTLMFILSKSPKHNITMTDVRDFIQKKKKDNPSYSTLSKEDMHEFLCEYGVDIVKSNRAFLQLKQEAPKVDRLDIDVKDLIDIAHASGGFVVLAHPARSLKKAVDPKIALRELISLGMDGIEKWYNCEDWTFERYDQMIVECLNELSKEGFEDIVFTGGSDTHNFEHGVRLGLYSEKEIVEDMLRMVISKLQFESISRKQRGINRGIGKSVDVNYIEDLVQHYLDRAEELAAGSIKETVPPAEKTIKKAIAKAKKKKRTKKSKKSYADVDSFDDDLDLDEEQREKFQKAIDEAMEKEYSEHITDLIYGDD